MVIYNGVSATMEKEEPKWQSAVTRCLHGVWFKGKRANKPKQPFVRCVAPTHCAALWAKRTARARAGEGEVAGFTHPIWSESNDGRHTGSKGLHFMRPWQGVAGDPGPRGRRTDIPVGLVCNYGKSRHQTAGQGLASSQLHHSWVIERRGTHSEIEGVVDSAPYGGIHKHFNVNGRSGETRQGKKPTVHLQRWVRPVGNGMRNDK